LDCLSTAGEDALRYALSETALAARRRARPTLAAKASGFTFFRSGDSGRFMCDF